MYVDCNLLSSGLYLMKYQVSCNQWLIKKISVANNTQAVSSIGGLTPPSKNVSPGYNTKLHMLVRIQFQRFEECGEPLHGY